MKKTSKPMKIKETMDFYNMDGSVKAEYKALAIKSINASNIKAFAKRQEFTRAPHSAKPTSNRQVKERKAYRPIEEVFADMAFQLDMAHRLEKHADLVHEYMNKYFDIGHELICRKAIKLLHKVNVIIEPKRYTEVFNEARTLMYEELACWKEYKRKEVNEAGEEEITIYEAWHELPAQMLFYVLSDRVQRRLRKYVFDADNLNNQIALDSIAECESEEDLLGQIEQKVDRIGNMALLEGMLSKAQYKALTDYINGKQANTLGDAYKNLKKAIRAGRLNADDLRDLLPLIKKGDYEATRQGDFEARKGMAQILRKLS